MSNDPEYKSDGGPAFPAVETTGYDELLPGMSLRDYFAAVALRNCNHQGSVEWLASEAYRLADAMLAARVTK